MSQPNARFATFFKEKLKKWLPSQVPQNIEAFYTVLKQSKQAHIIKADALVMMEGVLQVSEMQVRDIIIPRASMEVIQRDMSIQEIMALVLETKHSRFPVIGKDRGEVIGILLAKDLLQYCNEKKAQTFNIRDITRTPYVVPESKRLNVLLKAFQDTHNHMAVVIDEYGLAAGIVTIEDVIEQIVGNIEDEHDIDETVGAIFQLNKHEFNVKAHLQLDDFNDFFKTTLEHKEVDTIGGYIVQYIGHLPKRGEIIKIEQITYRIVKADSKKIRLLRVTPVNNG